MGSLQKWVFPSGSRGCPQGEQTQTVPAALASTKKDKPGQVLLRCRGPRTQPSSRVTPMVSPSIHSQEPPAVC